jgi:hypothetical protein
MHSSFRVAKMASHLTLSIRGRAQCRPLHAVVRWRSVTRPKVLAPRNEAQPCRSCRL